MTKQQESIEFQQANMDAIDLLLASIKENNLDSFKKILTQNPEIEFLKFGQWQNTIMHEIAKTDWVEGAKFLLENTTDAKKLLSIKNLGGTSSLDLSYRDKKYEMFKFLIDNIIKIESDAENIITKNYSKQLYEHLAIEGNIEMFNFLSEHKFIIDNPENLFHIAFQTYNPELMQTLIKNKNCIKIYDIQESNDYDQKINQIKSLKEFVGHSYRSIQEYKSSRKVAKDSDQVFKAFDSFLLFIQTANNILTALDYGNSLAKFACTTQYKELHDLLKLYLVNFFNETIDEQNLEKLQKAIDEINSLKIKIGDYPIQDIISAIGNKIFTESLESFFTCDKTQIKKESEKLILNSKVIAFIHSTNLISKEKQEFEDSIKLLHQKEFERIIKEHDLSDDTIKERLLLYKNLRKNIGLSPRYSNTYFHPFSENKIPEIPIEQLEKMGSKERLIAESINKYPSSNIISYSIIERKVNKPGDQLTGIPIMPELTHKILEKKDVDVKEELVEFDGGSAVKTKPVEFDGGSKKHSPISSELDPLIFKIKTIARLSLRGTSSNPDIQIANLLKDLEDAGDTRKLNLLINMQWGDKSDLFSFLESNKIKGDEFDRFKIHKKDLSQEVSQQKQDNKRKLLTFDQDVIGDSHIAHGGYAGTPLGEGSAQKKQSIQPPSSVSVKGEIKIKKEPKDRSVSPE